MPDLPPLFNVADVADKLEVSRSTVNRRIAKGEVKPDFEVSGYNGDRLFTAATLLELINRKNQR